MSLCIQCLKDSKEHTKTEWRRHQATINAVKTLTVQCEFCRRKKGVHSDELWEIHDNVVKNACLKNGVRRADLGLIQEYGRIRPYPAIIKKQLMADGSVNIVPNPIFMKCKHKISENKICGKYLGNDEEDLADVIGEMCFKCFCEETSQEAGSNV